MAVNLPLTCLALCWQGPAAARGDVAGTQQEESGQQSGNRSAADEPDSPHQSVSRWEPKELLKDYRETLVQRAPCIIKKKKKKKEEKRKKKNGSCGCGEIQRSAVEISFCLGI